MKLNHLSNIDKNLQQKMRYFADYFSFANEYLGKLPVVPFDNHLSLIDKALFQIETNYEHCPLYVVDYLSQFFRFYNKSFEDENELINSIESKFLSLKTHKNKKEWMNQNPDLLYDLRIARAEFENKLFDTNFSALLNIIRCRHNLKKHKRQIQYHAQVLVSIFRFKGHSKDSLDTYIKRILSNNRYDFPFPLHIQKIKTKSEYEESTKEYLANRDFNMQFEGLKNIYIADQHKQGYFFFVIDNVVVDDAVKAKFKVVFDRVTFISPSHVELKKLRKSVREHDREEGGRTYPVFFGKDKLLAYLNMGYENTNAKKDDGLRVVADELLSLNQYFEGGLLLNNLHYLFSDSFDGDSWSASTSLLRKKKQRISKSDFEEFQGNTHEYLRNINSPAKPLILEYEKTFLKAFARDEVEYYWIYIENVFAPLTKDTGDMRKMFSKILIRILDELKDDLLIKIGHTLTPFSFNYKEEGLEKEDVYKIHEEIFARHNFQFDLSAYKTKFQSVLLQDLIDLHRDFNSVPNAHKWKTNFDSLMIDLYGYRNSLVHSGFVNEFAKIKLLAILPKLISRARWLIIKTCKQHPNLLYPELIHSITTKRNSLNN